MSPRRRWTNAAASLRRSGSRSGPVRSSGRSANSGSSKASSERNASSLPLWGVAVTRIRWRSGSLGEALQELVALVAAAPGASRRGAGVGLVDDHQLGAGAQEVVAAAVGLDEVGRDDDVGVMLEERLRRRAGRAPGRVAVLGSTSSASMWNLSRSSACHCSARWGGQSTARFLRLAAVEQLAGDQAGLDGLADADVVGDQQPHRVQLQRHQERHELVRPGLDGELGERAERAGARAEAQPHGVAQQPARREVAELGRIGKVEAGRLDRFQRQVDAGDLVVGAAQRAQHQEVVGRFGQHDPFAAPRLDQRADGEGHACLPPKMLG